MLQLEPVGFHLEKTLVARKPFRGAGLGRELQTRFGVPFNFPDQVLHGRISCEQNGLKSSAAASENLVACRRLF